MPLMNYKCKSCGHIEEELVKRPVPQSLDCVQCGAPAPRVEVGYLIAKTPGRWGDQTGKYGVNGHYDYGLGATYHNSMEKERIMKSKGLIPLSDLGTHAWDDAQDRARVKAGKRATLVDNYNAAKAKHGDDTAAVMAEAMPADKCIRGDFDDIFDDLL